MDVTTKLITITDIVVARATQAKELGAAMIMLMPPYHGALMRGTAQQTFDQFKAAGAAGIPIMVQDAPMAGNDLMVWTATPNRHHNVP